MSEEQKEQVKEIETKKVELIEAKDEQKIDEKQVTVETPKPEVRDYTNYDIEEFKENLIRLSSFGKQEDTYGFNLTVIGRRHVQENTVCQDYSGLSSFSSRKDARCFAVSDGHGSVPYSQDGSSIAIESLFSIIEDMLSLYPDDEVVELMNGLFFKEKLVQKWKQQVISHALSKKRITTEDVNNKSEEALVSPYGCTLLFVMQLKDTVICGNIGDGEIVLLNSENKNYKHINEEDSLDESTLSLSHLRPDFCVTKIFSVLDYDYALICTDGISKPFGYMFDGILQNINLHMKNKSIEDLLELFINLIHEDYKMLSDDMSVSFGKLYKEIEVE